MLTELFEEASALVVPWLFNGSCINDGKFAQRWPVCIWKPFDAAGWVLGTHCRNV